MVTKPVAFVIAVALVVVAAGTGAYIAVRHNGSAAMTDALAPEPEPGAPRLGDVEVGMPEVPQAVDATEEVVIDDEATSERGSGADAPVPVVTQPAATSRVDRAVTPTEPRAAPATPKTDPIDVARARRVPPATPGPARNLPEVDGWERLDAPWPTRRAPEGPDRVALSMIDPDWLGLDLDPELRPPIIEKLVISADSVIGLQIDTAVSTEDAQVEDDVQARVTRDVMVADQVAVPAGTLMMGSVVLVEQGGKIKGASRLGVRFHTVVMDDGVEVPVVTETVYRESSSKGGQSAAKIGGAAVGGAILGAIFGGRQGAAIGGAAGAAGGTAAAMAGDPNPATLRAGATVTVRLSRPATVTVER